MGTLESKATLPRNFVYVTSTANSAHFADFLVNGPNWQRFLAGSSKTALSILIFSIVVFAEYSFYVKSIAICAPQRVDIIIHS